MSDETMCRDRIERIAPSNHHPRRWTLPAALAVSMLGSAGLATAQHTAHDGAVGTVDFAITCSERAQSEFNRAVALLHHMTYPQAREAFERVAAADSRCAMAHWGIAMTLFQPLWPTRPGPRELQQGWEAVQRAKALQPAAERERRFLATAEAFFLEPASPDYWLRIRRWREATEQLYGAFPDDPEATAFYALSLLATTPSDATSRTAGDRAAELLLRLYERNPDHPGASHYLVHANDMPGRERESMEITRKYAAVAPRNPHALHMPTHIYTRLGEWNEVIEGNQRAADAALEIPAGERQQYVWDEFPHAIEYLVYAYLQTGADEKAAAQVKRLRATDRLEPTFKTAFHLVSIPSRYALERRAWEEAVQLVPREPASLDWDRFAWPEAIVHFARGLGAVHLRDLNQASASSDRLGELEAAMRRVGEDLFARNVRVLRLELDAWRAHAAGRADSSIRLLQEAVELEAATPKHAVTPGPTLPATELLGDLLMEQRKPREALTAYERAMALYPRRFNSLLGAARASRAIGDSAMAQTHYRALVSLTDAGSQRSAIVEARQYLGQGR